MALLRLHAVLDLIIDADSCSDFVFSEIQECGLQAAAEIADAALCAYVRIRCSKPHPRNEVIDSGVSHYLRS